MGVAGMAAAPAPRGDSARAFYGLFALLFAGGAALTVAWCRSMPALCGLRMPGGWILSTAWLRLPGQSWAGAAAAFLGMWAPMMGAMMLPALAPMLWRYRQAAAAPARRNRLTALAAAAYWLVWTAWGVVVFAPGAALAQAALRWPALARAMPLLAGAVVLAAGALQFSRWKARRLACCRGMAGHGPAAGAAGAWRHGLQLGLHCSACCAGPTAVLLALGVMDLRAMAVVTAAIAAERLAPGGERVARAVGVVAVAAGLALLARAAAG